MRFGVAIHGCVPIHWHSQPTWKSDRQGRRMGCEERFEHARLCGEIQVYRAPYAVMAHEHFRALPVRLEAAYMIAARMYAPCTRSIPAYGFAGLGDPGAALAHKFHRLRAWQWPSGKLGIGREDADHRHHGSGNEQMLAEVRGASSL